MEVLLCFGLPAENEHVDFSCPQKFIAYPQPHEILKCQFFFPQLFLKVPLLILLLVKVPFFNMMSLEMVLAVSRKEAIIWLPAVINIYL